MYQHGPCKIYIISTRITQSQYWSFRCKYRIYLNAFGHTSDGIAHAGQFSPCRVNRAIVISSSHKVCAREIEQCAHHTRTRTPHAPVPHRQLNAYRTQLGAYIGVGGGVCERPMCRSMSTCFPNMRYVQRVDVSHCFGSGEIVNKCIYIPVVYFTVPQRIRHRFAGTHTCPNTNTHTHIFHNHKRIFYTNCKYTRWRACGLNACWESTMCTESPSPPQSRTLHYLCTSTASTPSAHT